MLPVGGGERVEVGSQRHTAPGDDAGSPTIEMFLMPCILALNASKTHHSREWIGVLLLGRAYVCSGMADPDEAEGRPPPGRWIQILKSF